MHPARRKAYIRDIQRLRDNVPVHSAREELSEAAEQHLHLSHSYELQGAYQAAIEQVLIARRSVRNDFYLQSQLDVRLKALQAKATEEKAEAQR